MNPEGLRPSAPEQGPKHVPLAEALPAHEPADLVEAVTLMNPESMALIDRALNRHSMGADQLQSERVLASFDADERIALAKAIREARAITTPEEAKRVAQEIAAIFDPSDNRPA